MNLTSLEDSNLKYECKYCGIMCFDGSTDESLPEDVKQHELGYFHKMMKKEKEGVT